MMSDTVDTSRSKARKQQPEKSGIHEPETRTTDASRARSTQSAPATSGQPIASKPTATSNAANETPATRSQARTALGLPDEDTIQALAEAAVRHLSVDKIMARCGSSAAMEIARLELNDTSVDNVIVEGLSTEVRCGSAVLHDVRAILELNFTAHWSYDLKWLGSDSGIKVLGSKANTIELHDIRLPMLQDFRFEIPEVELDDVDIGIDPIIDISLGGSELEGLLLTETDAPSEGFSLAGIDLGDLQITGLEIPGTRTGSMSVDNFKPTEPLVLPGVKLGPISIPGIEIDDVGSDGAVSIMGAELEPIEAPVFKIGSLFKIKLVVDPVLHLQIGELVLSELEASARIESVSAMSIRSSINIDGLSMEELVLQDAHMNSAKLNQTSPA